MLDDFLALLFGCRVPTTHDECEQR
jgi:hypothetical protein